MDTRQAYRIGRELMDKHGIPDWSLKLENAYSRLGVCFTYEKEIRISYQFTENGTMETVKDTILHEIAHALVGPGHGHDEVWKSKCREIGANPNRVNGEKPTVEKKWVAICPDCGRRFGRMKRVKVGHIRWCRKCYKRGTEHGILKFELNAEYQRRRRS